MKAIIAFSAICLSPMLYANSIITLDSEQGEYIGGGKQHTLTGDFTATITESKISIWHESGFNFTFRPENGQPLTARAFLDAERDPFKGPYNPGISVGSTGKGCNTISGEFYIYEIDTSATQPSLAMDFVQYCGYSTSALKGAIRINTSTPIPYPKPLAAIQVSSVALTEGDQLLVNGIKSQSPASTVQSYFWEYVSGPAVSIVSPTQVESEINLQDSIALGGEELVLSLTVTDQQGETSSIDKTISIASKSDPRTYFKMQGETGDYISQGKDWFYDSANSDILAQKNFDNGVSISIRGSESWSADFAAPGDQQLEEKTYTQATRYPFQELTDAGLNISGNGRGCNRSNGQFTVNRVTWVNDKPEQFFATFEQACENSTAKVRGEVSVNSPHPSVPVANAGETFSIKEHQLAHLDGTASFDNLGEIVSYQWTSSAAISIENAQTSLPHFIAPALPDGAISQAVELQLLVTDEEGYQAIDSVNVIVEANNASPEAIDDQAELNDQGTVEISVLENDTDPDGSIDASSIEIVTQPQSGSITITSQGIIQYTQTKQGQPEDSFTYTVKDNDGAASNPAKVTIFNQQTYPEFVLGQTQVKNGDIITFQGECFLAKNSPGPWQKPKVNSWFWSLVNCNATIVTPPPETQAWQANKVYLAGDIVTFETVQFQARWWTRGERPDPSSTRSVWQKL